MVIYRINPYYDLGSLQADIVGSLDFYHNLETDADTFSVKDSSDYTETEEEYKDICDIIDKDPPSDNPDPEDLDYITFTYIRKFPLKCVRPGKSKKEVYGTPVSVMFELNPHADYSVFRKYNSRLLSEG